MSDKMKRLLNCIVPVTACNFKCHYCYIGQTDGFKGEVGALPYSLDYIAHALRPERIGEHCHFNLCGSGETLIAPYVIELVDRLTRMEHYCTIVTNGVLTHRFEELCSLPKECLSHVFVKFSFHYLELERQNLFSRFWENVKRVKQAGCAFSLELTVNDESIPHIPEIQRCCMENVGAACHVIESRDNRTEDFSRLTGLPVEEHQKNWNQFESPLFKFQQKVWGQKRREFCYAGDWVTSFYLQSGDVYTCFAGGEKLGNLYDAPEEVFPFVAVGENCPWAHCYAAYVLLTSGAIPHFPAPSYAQVRDRVCTDGSTWLTPEFQGFFGSRFCESNREYSPEKKAYINALMAVEHHNAEAQIDYVALGKIVKEYLHSRGIYKAAVYGGGEKADFLCRILNAADMPPLFCIDSAFEENAPAPFKEKIKRQLRYSVRNHRRKAPSDQIWLTRYDRWPRVDVVIVPEHADFERCKKVIERLTSARVLSSIEIVG